VHPAEIPSVVPIGFLLSLLFPFVMVIHEFHWIFSEFVVSFVSLVFSILLKFPEVVGFILNTKQHHYL
jgi:hypothetical protein